MLYKSNVPVTIEINTVQDLSKLGAFMKHNNLKVNKSEIARALNINRRTVTLKPNPAVRRKLIGKNHWTLFCAIQAKSLQLMYLYWCFRIQDSECSICLIQYLKSISARLYHIGL